MSKYSNLEKLTRNSSDFPSALKGVIQSSAVPYLEWNVLKYYQYVVREYMLHLPRDTRGLLVKIEMGMGKTFIPIAIYMEMLNIVDTNVEAINGPGAAKYRCVVISPKSLRDNFIDNVVKYCRKRAAFDPTYIVGTLPDDDLTAYVKRRFAFVSLNAGNMIAQVNKAMSNDFDQFDFEDVTADADVNTADVAKSQYGTYKKAAEAIKKLENVFLVIDEAHNFFRAITNGSENARKLYTGIMDAKNIKLMFLTGTPIANDPFEVVPCFNMLAGKTIFPTNYEDFVKLFTDGRRSIKNKQYFQNRIFGLVSNVVSGSQQPVFTDRDDAKAPLHTIVPNEFIKLRINLPEKLPINTVKCPMDTNQWILYLLAREKEREENLRVGRPTEYQNNSKPKSSKTSSYRVKSRQISNFAPNFEKSFKLDIKFTDVDVESLQGVTSPKFRAMLDSINSSTGKVLVYSQFVGAGGIRAFSKFLRESGYKEIKNVLSGDLLVNLPTKENNVMGGAIFEKNNDKNQNTTLLKIKHISKCEGVENKLLSKLAAEHKNVYVCVDDKMPLMNVNKVNSKIYGYIVLNSHGGEIEFKSTGSDAADAKLKGKAAKSSCDCYRDDVKSVLNERYGSSQINVTPSPTLIAENKIPDDVINYMDRLTSSLSIVHGGKNSLNDQILFEKNVKSEMTISMGGVKKITWKLWNQNDPGELHGIVSNKYIVNKGDNSEFIYIVYLDGNDIGYFVIDILPLYTTIVHIFLKEEFRRHGIGSQIVKFITKMFSKCVVDVDKTYNNFDEIVRFLTKCGFSERIPGAVFSDAEGEVETEENDEIVTYIFESKSAGTGKVSHKITSSATPYSSDSTNIFDLKKQQAKFSHNNAQHTNSRNNTQQVPDFMKKTVTKKPMHITEVTTSNPIYNSREYIESLNKISESHVYIDEVGSVYSISKLVILTRHNEIHLINPKYWFKYLNDFTWWDNHGDPVSPMMVMNSPKKYSKHFSRIRNADNSYPIILTPDRKHIIDGVHRLSRCFMEKCSTMRCIIATSEQMLSSKILAGKRFYKRTHGGSKRGKLNGDVNTENTENTESENIITDNEATDDILFEKRDDKNQYNNSNDNLVSTVVITGSPPDVKSRKFISLTGEITLEERRMIQTMYNSPTNVYGNDVFVLNISSTGAEGLDLKEVQQVEIMEPHWTYLRILQIQARAVRNDSHIRLPPNLRKVKTNLYLAVAPPAAEEESRKYREQIAKITPSTDQNNRTANKQPEMENKFIDIDEFTTDVSLYNEALANYNYINGFIDAMNEVSIECISNGEAYCRRCAPTSEKLFTDNVELDVKIKSPCADYSEKEVEVRSITLQFPGGEKKTFHYKVDRGVVYVYGYNKDMGGHVELSATDPDYIKVVNALNL